MSDIGHVSYRYEVRAKRPGSSFYNIHIWRDGKPAEKYGSYVHFAWTRLGAKLYARRWIRRDAKQRRLQREKGASTLIVGGETIIEKYR